MESDEWESDGEFEATILSMAENESDSKVVVTSKIKTEPLNVPVCSTPICDGDSRPVDHHSVMSGSMSTISFVKSPSASTELCATSTPQPAAQIRSFKPNLASSSTGQKKRKFPGPAGTLPKLRRDVDIRALKDVPVEVEPEVDQNEELLSSQASQPLSVSSYSAWRRLVGDMELSKEHLHNHSISNALSNACKKQLPEGKVPLLAAVIVSINKSLPDATVTLKDLTGSINGVIHRLLVKQHHEHLKLGSAMLLKQVAVFSPSRRKQYLNITPNNLLQIYSEHEKTAEVQKTEVTKLLVPLNTLLTQPISSPRPDNVHPTSSTHSSRDTLHKQSNPRQLFNKPNKSAPQQPLAERINGRDQNINITVNTVTTNHPSTAHRLTNHNFSNTPITNQIVPTNRLSNPVVSDRKDARFTNTSGTVQSTSTNLRQQFPVSRLSNVVTAGHPPLNPPLNHTNQHLFDDDDLDDLDLDF